MACSSPVSIHTHEELELTTEVIKRDWNQRVSDQHIEKFSRSHGKKWRSLPPYLELETIAVDDIDRNPRTLTEEEKRHAFFSKWKHVKGSRATYRRLVGALLKIQCREDAENLCEMLKTSVAAQRKAKVRHTLSGLFIGNNSRL